VGTIYAPLNRLHRHGYLESEIRQSDDPAGGKPIKYYRLTQKGLEALATLKEENRKMWEGFHIPLTGAGEV
jgi:DNA-binding PadR family transcriptional regulator